MFRLHVCMYSTVVPDILRGQKRSSDALGLELRLMKSPMLVLAMKPRSSAGAAGASNLRAPLQALALFLLCASQTTVQ